MNNFSLPSRQVHLDFHTSEHIAGIGARFSRRQFQQALKLGHVNSITVFAKCHHGWSYYSTKVGRRHPHLKFDLLGEQIRACHAIGVRAPIYMTVGWSARDAATHPDWVVRDAQGNPVQANLDPKAKPGDKRPVCSWTFLCPSGGYRDLIVRQTAEICRRYDVDGIFYDINATHATCYCRNCLAGMKKEGFNPRHEPDARAYNRQMWKRFMAACREVILTPHPAATVFFNGTAHLYGDDFHAMNTHFELEDLPTMWGGYNKFPIRSRKFARQSKPTLAMSGKFHTVWGEFGGFKHPDALHYETASMIAFGARCSIGDQLHPSGEMDLETYRWLGQAYGYVKQIEAYGLDGQPASNLGLWLSGSQPHDEGLANILLEGQQDFEVVLPGSGLSRYATVIVPGAACLDETSANALNAFARKGGSLVVFGEGALNREKHRFLLEVGADYLGPARYENDYLVVGPGLRAGLVSSPFLCYSGALRTRLRGATALAAIREPYFNRTYARYCSHQNTPYRLTDAAHPGILKKGSVLFFAHALDALYAVHGARLHRDLVLNGLRLMHRRPTLSVEMPSCGRVSLVHQPRQNRYVAHVLYAPALQRGRCQVIEDLVPLRNVPITLRVPEKIRRVRLVPQNRPLPLKRRGGQAEVVVPEFRCHQAVVFEYA
ncbi:MAG: beta-galactosidase [Lentisphaerae bacterium]|nr:beta-galactosidase [Lentisphaerota bacterium]